MLKSPAVELLRVIGSPLAPSVSPGGEESPELYHCAVSNKIPLLYLDSLRQQGKLNELKPEYERRYAGYLNYQQGAARVSRVLGDAGIRHVILKSIKPYLATGGDLDVIVLGEDDMYKQAVRVLLKGGYTTAVPQIVGEIALGDESTYEEAVEILTKPTYGRDNRISPTGTDLIDPEHSIDIDLQKDLATSYIVWVDKERFTDCVVSTRFPDGQEASTPTPEFDLVTVIAHSLMEQLYLLGEFYTLLHRLSGMSEEEVSNFVSIVEENRLKAAVRAFTTVTVELHRAAYGTVPEGLEFVLNKLGSDASEAKNLLKNGFKTPHRYRPLTIARVFREKIGERRFRRSLARQLIKMLNPGLTRLVILELAEMRRRETYLKGAE